MSLQGLPTEVLHLIMALLPPNDMPTLLSALHLNLREDFSVPHSATIGGSCKGACGSRAHSCTLCAESR